MAINCNVSNKVYYDIFLKLQIKENIILRNKIRKLLKIKV